MPRLNDFLTRAGVLAGLLLQLGCRQKPPPVEPEPAPDTLARGDHAVVELRAAEFFEARVLDVNDSGLKLEELPSGKSHTAQPGDVYALEPPPAAEKGALYVCRLARLDWRPCRLDAATGPTLTVTLADGEQAALSLSDLLLPTELTKLNIQGRFERTRRVREYRRDARAAGAPRAPAGWSPSPREALLVRLSDAWFSATLFEIMTDGYRVRLTGEARTIETTREALLPQPPYAPGTVRSRAFVLARPEAIAEAWQVWRVAEVGSDHLQIEDAEGRRRRVTERDVVPLSR